MKSGAPSAPPTSTFAQILNCMVFKKIAKKGFLKSCQNLENQTMQQIRWRQWIQRNSRIKKFVFNFLLEPITSSEFAIFQNPATF